MVVHIGGVAAALAAVCAGKGGLGAVEADAQPVGAAEECGCQAGVGLVGSMERGCLLVRWWLLGHGGSKQALDCLA